MENSLSYPGVSLADTLSAFTGRTSKHMALSIKELSEKADLTNEEIQKTNELVEQDTMSVIEAINGLASNNNNQSLSLASSVDQLVGQMFKMNDLTEEQSFLLNEIKGIDAEAASQNKEEYENLLAAVELLAASGIQNEAFLTTLKGLDSSLRDEALIRAVNGIGDGLDEDRLKAEQDATRGGGTADVLSGKKEEGSEEGILDVLGDVAGIGNFTQFFKKGGFKALLKTLGKAGLIGMAISTVFDAFQGFNNAAEIVGKKQEELTLFDKSMAALAAVGSGLTFGLVDAKDVYAYGGDAWNYITSAIDKGFEGWVDKFSGGIGFLFDDLSTVVSEFFTEFVPDQVNFIIDTIQKIFSIDSLDDGLSVLTDIKDHIMGLFSDDGFIGKVLSFIKNISSFLTLGLSDVMTGFASDAVASIGGSETFGKIKDFLGFEDDSGEATIAQVGQEAQSTRYAKEQIQQVMRTEETPTSMAIVESKKRLDEANKPQMMPAPNVIVNVPPAQTPAEQPTRRRDLGNIGLHTVNSGAYD